MIRVLELRRSPRDRLVDVLMTAIAAGLGVFVLLASQSSVDGRLEGSIPGDLAVGGLACAGLLVFRRTRPTGTAVAVIIMGFLASSPMGAVAMALFSVAVHRPWRVTATIAVAYALAILTIWRLAPISTREYLEGVITILLSAAVLVAYGMLVRSHRQLVGSLRERARQAEEGQRLRVEEARHLERERLAREMHDVLAHRISLLAVHAGALEFRPGTDPEEARAAGVIRQCAHEAMEDLREVIGMLRDSSPGADPQRPQPSLTDIPVLIEQSADAGAHVTLQDRVGEPVPARIGRHAYRIVQEGLTNARKHAPGARVLVSLDGSPGDGLAIEVRNPMPPVGRADLLGGPGELPGAGVGLVGLRERVELLGGRLEHGTAPEGDFRLAARLPWPP